MIIKFLKLNKILKLKLCNICNNYCWFGKFIFFTDDEEFSYKAFCCKKCLKNLESCNDNY